MKHKPLNFLIAMRPGKQLEQLDIIEAQLHHWIKSPLWTRCCKSPRREVVITDHQPTAWAPHSMGRRWAEPLIWPSETLHDKPESQA
jgi:hypothetical protein